MQSTKTTRITRITPNTNNFNAMSDIVIVGNSWNCSFMKAAQPTMQVLTWHKILTQISIVSNKGIFIKTGATPKLAILRNMVTPATSLILALKSS